MRLLALLLLLTGSLFKAAFAQDACRVLQEIAANRTNHFSDLIGEKVASGGGALQYRSKLILPQFDQSYFTREDNGAAPVFTAKIIGFPSLEAAGKSLDSILQRWSSCLRGYTFYKEENCHLGCSYYVAPNDSRDVLFYVSYQEEPGQEWYGITLQMPGGKPAGLPPGLTLLSETHPPLDIPAGNLDACQTLQLYLKAGANRFQDLLSPDGSFKVKFPESQQTEVTSKGTARIVLATQTGDEGTDLDEAYLITQGMLNQCLAGWSQLELVREDDADFLNDRKWLKTGMSVSLQYEVAKGGKGKNKLVLLISVR